MHEAHENKLRGELLLVTVAFGALWGLILVSLLWGSSPGWAVGATVVAMIAYPWLIFACVRNGLGAVWCNSTLLFTLAATAVFPAALAFVSTRAFVTESLPDNLQALRYFERTFGEPPDDAVSNIYFSRDRSQDRGIFTRSESPYLLQFSVPSAAYARGRLEQTGFVMSCREEHPYANAYHPADFPILWLPPTVSSHLEMFCASDGAAWLDSENRAVYMVLSMGWRPHR